MVHTINTTRMDAIIGRTFTSTRGRTCTVLDVVSERDAGDKLCLVEFETTKSKKIVRNTHLLKGEFKDVFAPSVYGVGYLGEATSQNEEGKTKRLYHMWKRMIGFCMSEAHRDFHAHEAESVCDAWLCFATFEEDVTAMKDFDSKGGLRLMAHEIVWSKDTCIWKSKKQGVHRA